MGNGKVFDDGFLGFRSNELETTSNEAGRLWALYYHNATNEMNVHISWLPACALIRCDLLGESAHLGKSPATSWLLSASSPSPTLRQHVKLWDSDIPKGVSRRRTVLTSALGTGLCFPARLCLEARTLLQHPMDEQLILRVRRVLLSLLNKQHPVSNIRSSSSDQSINNLR